MFATIKASRSAPATSTTLRRSALLPSLRSLRPAPSAPLARRAAPAQALPHQDATEALLSMAVRSGQSPAELMQLSEGLETPVELIYLFSLLGLLVTAGFIVVRQVLIRRELDESAKTLGEKVRVGIASSEDYFELGAILVRKKLYTQAVKNLEKCKQIWDGEEIELAQVYNALGFAYLQMERPDLASVNYREAVKLQPGYVTAWNNLGDALEKKGDFRAAFEAYQEALTYDSTNVIAKARKEYCQGKLTRLNL